MQEHARQEDLLQQDPQTRAAFLKLAASVGVSEEQYDKLRFAIANGARLADLFNIGSDALESAYAYAYSLYSAGNHADAERLFRGLCLYTGDDARFWLGLGGCLQAREAHEEAIAAYGMAAVHTTLKDPVPLYHIALCHIKRGDLESAEGALMAVLVVGGDDPAHEVCCERSVALLETVRNKLQEGGAS